MRRRALLTLTVWLAGSLWPAALAWAQADEPAGLSASEGKIYTGQKISLDYQNADIRRLLKIIGDISGQNLVIPDRVSGKVTLKLTDMPWDQALDIILAARNLGVEKSGNVLMIYDLSAGRAP